jgi:predicted RNase H-like HicB family nuclease
MSTTIEFEMSNEAYTPHWDPDWRSRHAYRCYVCLLREDDGSFSAVVLNLPGAGSCGETEEEAMRNVDEAIRGVIESHEAFGEDVPWREIGDCEIPAGAKLKWILVDA